MKKVSYLKAVNEEKKMTNRDTKTDLESIFAFGSFILLNKSLQNKINMDNASI